NRVTPPAVGRHRERRIFTSVVLPARLGPTRPNTSPGSMRKLTPETACKRRRPRKPAEYSLEMLSNSTTAGEDMNTRLVVLAKDPLASGRHGRGTAPGQRPLARGPDCSKPAGPIHAGKPGKRTRIDPAGS